MGKILYQLYNYQNFLGQDVKFLHFCYVKAALDLVAIGNIAGTSNSVQNNVSNDKSHNIDSNTSQRIHGGLPDDGVPPFSQILNQSMSLGRIFTKFLFNIFSFNDSYNFVPSLSH